MSSEEEFVEANADYGAFESDHDEEYIEEDLKHKNLINSIEDLNLPESVKRSRTRNEPRDVGEFNMLPNNRKVNLNQLVSTIKGANTNEAVGKIKKIAKKLTSKKVLDVPLEKIHQNRIERAVYYDKASKQIARWEPVVLQNRVADEMRFPLNQPSTRIDNAIDVSKQLKPKTNLEKEIQQILDSSENFLNEETPLTEAEEKVLKALSIDEAKARHQELRKTRALLSYREAKLHRQNKIKSKAYRRMLKRENLRKSMKEFEDLKKTDPKKALEKLQDLEKIRIIERASLKHKNTGKWAKMNKIRAKHDTEARNKLAEQLNLNKDLVKRLYEDSSEEENSDDEQSYDVDTKNKLLQFDVNDRNKINENGIEDQLETRDFFENNYKDLIEKMNVDDLKKSKHQKPQQKKSFNDKTIELDVQSESDENGSDCEEDEEEEYKRLVSEALADDDVMEDFKKDKKDTINNEKEKDQDNFLPGWGSWGGAGVKIKSKLRRKFIVKAKQVKRQDRKNNNIIFSEKKDEVISKFLPKSLPAGVKDKNLYQKKITKAIGSTWNPEIVFKNLVRPSVITKKGTKIDPMDERQLAKSARVYNENFTKKVNNLIKID